MAPFFPVLPQNVEIVVVAIAIAYTVISIVIQRKLSNPKKMREVQAKIQIVQKEMNEMLKRNAPQNELMSKQKEIMPLMGESMKSSMKPMFVIFPLLILTYYLIIPSLPFGSNNVASIKTTFFYIVFILGMVSAVIIMLYDRKKAKEEMKLLKEQESSGNLQESK